MGAVVTATLSGVSSLADFWGVTAAGILALAATVLTAVEKFLTAGDKVGVLARRYQDLAALADEATGAVADAREEVSTANPTNLSLADYEAWLGTKASELDTEPKKIN